MIWIVLIIALVAIFIINNLKKDGNDQRSLQGKSLQENFPELFDVLNKNVFKSEGKINQIEKMTYNLYKDGDNQILIFMYFNGNLAITWKYKYFHKEVVYEKIFHDAIGSSKKEQSDFAEKMINEMRVVIQNHKEKVAMNINSK